MLKTRIIATYGPSIEKESILSQIIEKSDAIRINFAHTSTGEAKEIVEKIRSISKKLKKEVGILADLPGPKIRLGNINGEIEVKRKNVLMFSKEQRKDAIKINYKDLERIKEGTIFSIGEGTLKFKLKKNEKGVLTCEALTEGVLTSRKGVNFYNTELSISSPTDEDIKLSQFCEKAGIDFLAESFVKESKDVEKLKKHSSSMEIIAKIERRQAIENLEEIANAADAIMVARGDLAFDVAIESIPITQRKIIHVAREVGKPVIVATQALASMVTNEMPTRAEVNDIAMAIYEGADAILLSDETAVGKYPVNAVETLRRTAAYAEKMKEYEIINKPNTTMDYIAYAASDIANKFGLNCIFAPTRTGTTAKRLSIFRPNTNIIAISESEKVIRQLSIYKGVATMYTDHYENQEELLRLIDSLADKIKAKKYIIVYGSGKAGSTDSLKYVEKA